MLLPDTKTQRLANLIELVVSVTSLPEIIQIIRGCYGGYSLGLREVIEDIIKLLGEESRSRR